MKIKALLPLAILSLILFSCGTKSDEEYRIKERKKMVKKIDSYTVDFYKALKITVRSLPFKNNFDSFNLDSLSPKDLVEKEELSSIQNFVLKLFHAALQDGEGEPFKASDYLDLAQGFSELKSNLKNKNEDDFPSILEIMDGVSSVVNEHEPVANTLSWSKETEHMMLFSLIEASRSLPAGFGLYELSQIKDENLPKNQMLVFARILKSVAYLENGYPYLSEEVMTMNMNDLQAGIIDMSALNHSSILEVKGPESATKEWHAISALMRSFSRYKMDRDDKKELAFDDLELFLDDTEELGADNELTWIAGTYLSLHNDEPEEALKYLIKLEGSSHLGKDEMEIVHTIKGYVEQKDTKKAFEQTRDQLFTGKTVIKYLIKKADKVEWKRMWNVSYPGKAMHKMVNSIDTQYEKSEGLS